MLFFKRLLGTEKSWPLIQTLKFFLYFLYIYIFYFFKVRMEMIHLLTSSIARFNKDN